MPTTSGLLAPLAPARPAAGRELDLLLDPFVAWSSLQADLAAARSRIDVELYMLVDDPVGAAFTQLLRDASRRGVRVRLVLDGVGTLRLPPSLAGLRAAGVEIRHFQPPLRTALHRWWHRDHRKVVVVDGEVAHVLGMNMGRQYFALQPGQRAWADAGVRLEGAAVAGLTQAFEQTWAGLGGGPLPAISKRPHGSSRALIALNDASDGRCDVHRRYLRALRGAERRAWLAHSYFLPGSRLQRALVRAARRGVDVRVLVPALLDNDVLLVSLAMHHAIGRLLDVGVRVFALQGRMMHAKFALVDDAWWTVGSANLDPLSRAHNLEANVVGGGAAEVEALAAYFDQLCVEATELTAGRWRLRPWWQKALGHSALRLRAWL